MLDLLPSHPLSRAEIRRLRTHDSIEEFIELVPPTHAVLNGGLDSATALQEGTVIALAFEDGEWTQTVLANGADKWGHITETLHYLEKR